MVWVFKGGHAAEDGNSTREAMRCCADENFEPGEGCFRAVR